MSKKRKHSSHGEEPSEAWLIPYADILTLLLALFIVLFASSTVNEEKYEAIMQAFHGVFKGNLPSPTEGEVLGPGEIELPTTDTIPPLNPTEETTNEADNPDEGNLDVDLQGIYKSIITYIDDKSLQDSVAVKILSESVLITLANDIWFMPGSATISDEMRSTAATMAAMFEEIQKANEKPLRIVVTGHTDNRPMNTVAFPSNWHLSMGRAVNFLQVLIESSTLDPRIFSTRGFGEYDPVDTNDTEEGRKHNRRVEVQVLYSADFEETEQTTVGETVESSTEAADTTTTEETS